MSTFIRPKNVKILHLFGRKMQILVSVPEIPLSGMADSTYFKIYMADVGLLRRKANINYRTILAGSDIFIHFIGLRTM